MISIIVPVYNVKEYIAKCLDSLLEQTYEELEILCIDDGSTDGSGEILDIYAQKDDRIKVYHQSNQGVSSARNMGLKISRGEYFGFVDPDDYVDKSMYQELFTAMEKWDADIVGCSHYVVKKTKSVPMTNFRKVPEYGIPTKKFLKYIYKRDIYKGVGSYIWTRLFKKECFVRNDEWNVEFDSQIIYGEGNLFLAQCVLKANTMAYVDKPLYYYVERDTSAMHNHEKRVKNMGSLEAYSKIIHLMKKHGVSISTIIWIKRLYVYLASQLLEWANQIQWHENDKALKAEIKRYLFEYILTNLRYPKRIGRIIKLL